MPRSLRILVGVDFSAASAHALEEAARLAGRTGGELDVLHVYPFGIAHGLAELVSSHDEVARFREAGAQLDGLRAMHVPPAVPANTHLRVGDPVEEILREAEALACDLVVVGSHGRGAVTRGLLGSVSEKVARRSAIPVLVVPSPERTAALRGLAAASAETGKGPRPEGTAAPGVSYTCSRCGHVRNEADPTEFCPRCGLSLARWTSAPLFPVELR